ncbi:hypothetical protein LSH36_729g02052 [Paralvinella palmiformis]|uniref:Uncharacterized protein n=1 Tax=Paralvinella palmiformis TaxID=53620 RepID=A0AAD9J2B6_9ANNE|nr:hypothetical protein LSH36_729g02052 [Paralvinella palmiformis]
MHKKAKDITLLGSSSPELGQTMAIGSNANSDKTYQHSCFTIKGELPLPRMMESKMFIEEILTEDVVNKFDIWGNHL